MVDRALGFVCVADAFSTGSSMMPNKNNLDPAELVRGRVGVGSSGGSPRCWTTVKGLPLAYQRDLEDTKKPLFEAVEVLRGIARGHGRAHRHARDRPRADALGCADEGYITATAVADLLVRRGVPFRAAHHIVGGLLGVKAEAAGRGHAGRATGRRCWRRALASSRRRAARAVSRPTSRDPAARCVLSEPDRRRPRRVPT